jgi:hypothetical protein
VTVIVLRVRLAAAVADVAAQYAVAAAPDRFHRGNSSPAVVYGPNRGTGIRPHSPVTPCVQYHPTNTVLDCY